MIQGVDVTVEIGFGSGPLDDPISWTDVSGDFREISFSRGRQYELDQINAGICTVVLNNRHGNYNANNTAGDYYPDVKPMTPIRIIASFGGNDYPLWQGFVERWPVSFPATVDSVVTVECVDLFKLLALAKRTVPPRVTVVEGLNPVAWYRMADEADEVGSNDLIFSGSPVEGGAAGAWTGDVATAFDGSNDSATFTTESAITRFNQDRSYEFWFTVGAGSGVDDLFFVQGTALYLEVSYFHTTSLLSTPVATVPVVAGYNHLVISDDHTADVRTVYLNGLNIGSGGLITESGTPDVHLGSTGIGGFWLGNISELAVYPTALTAQEAQALYQAQFDVFPDERTDERIGAFLADYGYMFTDLEEGQTTMSGVNSPEPTSILEGIQTAADTEAGTFFMTADGVARFQDRHYRVLEQDTPVASFTGPDYRSVILGFDDEQIFNRIEITTSEDSVFIAEDDTSMGQYGPRPLPRDIFPLDENEGYDAAHHLLARYKDAATRVESVTFRIGARADLIPTLLEAELGNRYNIEIPLQGDDLDEDIYLESIVMTLGANQVWDITWQLSRAFAQEFFVWGFSEWGINTVLAY